MIWIKATYTHHPHEDFIDALKGSIAAHMRAYGCRDISIHISTGEQATPPKVGIHEHGCFGFNGGCSCGLDQLRIDASKWRVADAAPSGQEDQK